MKYLAALLLAALAVISVPAASQAEICGEATTFNIQAYRPNGSVVTQQNKAERSETLLFTWDICPDAQVTDNFGWSHFGDFQFNRGISDQPTGGFTWVVSSQGDSRTKFIWINDVVPPPPPPPSTCCYPYGWRYVGNDGEYIAANTPIEINVPQPDSAHGCDTEQAIRTAKSLVPGPDFDRTVFKLTMTVYWCWTYPAITHLGVSCNWSDIETSVIVTSPCIKSGYYYNWRNHPKGGRYNLTSGTAKNCVFKYGCWKEDTINLKMWINGNGSWKKQTG